MDSLTQFALGAALGTVCLGRKIGVRRAAVTGGLLGTLPDLDVFLPADGPIASFVEHRSWSHSLFVHTLAAGPIGYGLSKLWQRHRSEKGSSARIPRQVDTPNVSPIIMALSVWIIFVTHALLDWTTTYGTQLLWPLDTTPYALSWIFIIDPFYSVPLFLMVVVALIFGSGWRHIQRGMAVSLVVSTAYLGWTGVAQEIAREKVQQALDVHAITPDQITMIPMPFNSFLWRGLVIDGGRYINVYRSVFDQKQAATLHIHNRHLIYDEALEGHYSPQRVETFSGQNYAYRRVGKDILISDLRMGITPHYVFTFKVGEAADVAALDGEGIKAPPLITPTIDQRIRQPRDFSDMAWLIRRITDEAAIRDE